MLRLGRDLEMPLAGVTQKFAFLGRTGSGKTYGAGKLAEEMLIQKAQVIVLDVVGNWYGLRIPKDKRNRPFDIVIFGGRHGDVGINAKAGKIVAQAILKRNLSAVVDISEFIEHEQMKFSYDFLTEFFAYRKEHPAACHLFLEEAQELVPQQVPPSTKGEESFGARMLHAAQRVLKIGRNYGIGATIITQRPQDVNKKVLNQTEVLFAFQMTGIQEKKTIAEWIKDKGQDENLADQLPKLETGNALVWSPAWLKISGMFKIGQKITADVSATPEVGAEPIEMRKLEPVDVNDLSKAIEALTAELEANSPAALKKKNVELQHLVHSLENELKKAGKPAVELHNVTVEVPVFPEALKHDLQTFVGDRILAAQRELNKVGIHLEMSYNNFQELINKKYADLPGSATPSKTMAAAAGAQSTASNETQKHAPPPRMPVNTVRKPVSTDLQQLSGLQQRIVNGLAEIAQFGSSEPDRKQLGFFIGSDLTGGAGSKAVAALKEMEIVDCPPGRVSLTDHGRPYADVVDAPADQAELHARIRKHLDGLQVRIFDALVSAYPDEAHRKKIGSDIGSDLTGGAGSKAAKRLVVAGIAVITNPGFLKAADSMFPESLN